MIAEYLIFIVVIYMQRNEVLSVLSGNTREFVNRSLMECTVNISIAVNAPFTVSKLVAHTRLLRCFKNNKIQNKWNYARAYNEESKSGMRIVT